MSDATQQNHFSEFCPDIGIVHGTIDEKDDRSVRAANLVPTNTFESESLSQRFVALEFVSSSSSPSDVLLYQDPGPSITIITALETLNETQR
jgi:hypothetical protein